MEPVISHSDVTTNMRVIANIQEDVRVIRNLLEEGDDEAEAFEDDA